MSVAESDEGVSRRDLIKRSAVAGGILWATPVIESVLTPAAAAGTPAPTTSTTPTTIPGPCTCAGPDPCGCQTPCNDQGCACNQNVTNGVPNGLTYCTVPTDCTNQVCSNDSDCATGEVCQATCCDEPRCFVVCDPGQGPALATPAGGWKSAGGTG